MQEKVINKGNKKDENIMESKTFTSIIYIGGALVLGLISIILSQNGFYWTSINYPFKISFWIFPISYVILLTLFGLATTIMWQSKTSEKKNSITSLYWAIASIIIYTIIPLFMVYINSKIVTLILVGINCIINTIVTYRYINSNIVAGCISFNITIITEALLLCCFWWLL